ncbi:MAG: SIS domain-containing protein [Candidatus Omnitrophica bacterium]|nr:SIS domain-containing protein [Candidatus Omnitrophota bacterium]
MKKVIRRAISDAIKTGTAVLTDGHIAVIESIARLMVHQIRKNGTIIVFGNGGSAADSQHFVAELVGRFRKERKAIPAISLTTNTSILTSIANDYTYDVTFKRQLEALAGPHDVVVGISTSGTAKNVIAALAFARSKKIKTVLLTGKDGGAARRLGDIVFIAPSYETPRIQEIHILVIHILAALVEEAVS